MTEATPGKRSSGRDRWLPRLALTVGVLLAVFGAIQLGLVGLLRDGDRVESFLTDSGAIGPIAYVMAFTAAQPFSIPGAVIMLPATFVWPGLTVFILSWTGGMIASTLGFGVARWLARDWIRARLPERILGWESRVDDHGTRAVIVLRVATGYAPAADWLLGVSTVNLRQFLVGTGIGLIPTTALVAFFGDDALRFAERLPWVVGGALAVAAVVVVVRKRRQAVEVSSSIEGPPS